MLLLAAAVALPGARLSPQAPQACATATASLQAQQLAASEEAHLTELARGRANFPVPANGQSTRLTFLDSDFDSRAAGKGLSGPDESILRDGNCIHASRAPVLGAAECAAVVTEARAAMASGQTSRFTYTAASRIAEVHVSELSEARGWLAQRLADTFWPLIESRYGGDCWPVHSSELAVYDALVIKYDASRGGTRQPMHRDAALISVNVALNSAEDYSGGGTFFEPLGDVLTLPQGHCLCHASGMRHAGHPILHGERWVLVIFVLAERATQHARRCGERGVEARTSGRQEDAKAAFLAGVEAAPADHELHHGLATVLAMEDDYMAARRSLRTAHALYPFCPKPYNGLGAMLVHAARPRAALRYFERALELSSEPDDDDGWDASVNAALCALMLAERDSTTGADMAVRWGAAMTLARNRIWQALVSTPSDRRLLNLLARTEAVAPMGPAERTDCRKLLGEASARHRLRMGAALVRSWEQHYSAVDKGGTLVIAFAGADAALGGGIQGGVPSHEFVRACRNAGVRRAIFVRDVLRAWYLRGIGSAPSDEPDAASGVGATDDSFEGMLSLLRHEIDRVRPTKLVTIGSSMGGYAAVRAGIELGADHIVAFAPQVVIDPTARASLQLPETPFTPFLEGLQAAGRVVGHELVGLTDTVRVASTSRSVVELHVGALDEGDVQEAALLKRAVDNMAAVRATEGLSCTVKVHEGRDHNLVVEMRDSGELHELLCRLVTNPETADTTRHSLLPQEFVGFEDCPDF